MSQQENEKNKTDHSEEEMKKTTSSATSAEESKDMPAGQVENESTTDTEKQDAENPFFKPEIDEEVQQEEQPEASENSDIEDAMVSESEKQQPEPENVVDLGDDDDEEEEDEEDENTSSGNHEDDMDNAVAHDSEDESASERHDIEKKDYHSMSKEALTDELERLLKNEKVQAIKEHVSEIRTEFNAKFDEEVEEKRGIPG